MDSTQEAKQLANSELNVLLKGEQKEAHSRKTIVHLPSIGQTLKGECVAM